MAHRPFRRMLARYLRLSQQQRNHQRRRKRARVYFWSPVHGAARQMRGAEVPEAHEYSLGIAMIVGMACAVVFDTMVESKREARKMENKDYGKLEKKLRPHRSADEPASLRLLRSYRCCGSARPTTAGPRSTSS